MSTVTRSASKKYVQEVYIQVFIQGVTMISFILLAVLGFASYRITRFLVIDTLLEGPRNKFHGFLINRSQKDGKIFPKIWNKIYELTSCTWCTGFWVTAAVYELWLTYDRSHTFLIIFALAGVQGLLHAYEPGDE